MIFSRLIQDNQAWLARCAVFAAAAWSSVLGANEPGATEAAAEESPSVFTSFEEAVDHAKARKQYILVACIKSGHEDSESLAAILDGTKLYLNPEEFVICQYRIEDDARAETFREHFKVAQPGLPIVVLADSAGKPLEHKAGLQEEYDYYSFIEEHAGYSALSLPGKVRLKRNIAASLVEAAGGKSRFHTPIRSWTLITGEKFTGAVLHSSGKEVTFETEDGDLRKVATLHLSKPDIEFIRKALERTKSFP